MKPSVKPLQNTHRKPLMRQTAHYANMLRHNVRFRELQPNVGSFRFALHEKLPLRKQALSSVSSRKILRSHTRIRFDIFQSPPAETRPTAQDTTKCPTHYQPDSECHAPTSSINGSPCTTRRSLNTAMHRPPQLTETLAQPADLSTQPCTDPPTKDSPCTTRSISQHRHAPTSSINGSPLHSTLDLGPGITSSRICATHSQIISLEFIDPILSRRLPSFERSPRCGIVSSWVQETVSQQPCTHNYYQLAFFTPGIKPLEAISRNWIRLIPNWRI